MFESYDNNYSSHDNDDISNNDVVLVFSFVGPMGLLMATSDTSMAHFCDEVVNSNSFLSDKARMKVLHNYLYISSIRRKESVFLNPFLEG